MSSRPEGSLGAQLFIPDLSMRFRWHQRSIPGSVEPGSSGRYRRFCQPGLLEHLFKSYYVGRVWLEPTTGGL
jgi:hypothetical protein